jgi:hypothetical protein
MDELYLTRLLLPEKTRFASGSFIMQGGFFPVAGVHLMIAGGFFLAGEMHAASEYFLKCCHFDRKKPAESSTRAGKFFY